MDFRHLNYIVTVADESSFSKAAQKLFISQPSLSQIIKKVEDDLNVKLFNRSKNPIVLTKEGELYVSRAKEILHIYEETKLEVIELSKGPLNKISIGAPFTLSNILFPNLLNEIKRLDYPIVVSPIELNSKELEELIIKDLIDFSISTYSFDNKMLHYKPITSEPFIFVLPKNHFLKNSSSISIQQIEEMNIPLLITKSGGMRTILNTYFKTNNIKPNIVFESKSLDTIISLVSAGVGVSIIPSMYMRSVKRWGNSKINLVDFDKDPPELTLGIVHKINVPLSPLVHEIIGIAEENILMIFNKREDD